MRKNFNSVQMLETSDVCSKYSKSVSYETLVGGTTTIGREYKQIRRLFLSSANKPLTALGTLTSLLRNSAKVVEKWLQISPVLRLVKVLGLVAVLSFTIITESQAECYATERNWIDTCYEWKPGVPNNCGEGCTYNYNNGKLTVTATKPDAVVSKGMFSESFYESGNRPYITDVEIDGEFKTIGYAAFNISANIHGKDGVLIVNETGSNAFDGSNVTGTVIVNDGQTELVDGPWSNLRTGFNGTLILPPSITSISGWFLHNLSLGADAKVYCGAENCEEMFRNVDCEGFGKKWGESSGTRCKNKLNNLLDGKLLAYPDGCTKMGALGCTKCKNENFKLNDGECDRLRWTPAEAAEVLTDDNNNSVTITFKK